MKGVVSSTIAAAGVAGVFTLYPMPGPAGWAVMISITALFGVVVRRRRMARPA